MGTYDADLTYACERARKYSQVFAAFPNTLELRLNSCWELMGTPLSVCSI